MEKVQISQNEIINQLLKVGHKNLDIYTDIGLRAVKNEPELFAHMIAWNHLKGQVRDTKTALPVIALRGDPDEEFFENAVAHLCQLDPRNLVRAVMFHKSGKLPPVTPGGGAKMKEGIKRYLAAREQRKKWWEKTTLQHRKSMKALYALYHIKPSDMVQKVLFDNTPPQGTIFHTLKQLKNMGDKECAGTILNSGIPFNIAIGAVGGVKGRQDVILALIEKMSGNELINNTNMLQKLGVFSNETLKAAFDSALERAKKDKRVSTLKADRAANFVKDKSAKEKLKSVRDEKLQQLGSIEGDWLVLGDKSSSMSEGIESARRVAALIANQVSGKVHLVFFNHLPTYFDVTGMQYDQIVNITRRQRASGITSIGCGLYFILQKRIAVNGIAICTDCQENENPKFATTYKKYVNEMGIEPTVYIFGVGGHYKPHYLTQPMVKEGIMYELFDIRKDVDYYSLPNLVQTLKTRRYALIEEIMETPLLTFKQVFPNNGGQKTVERRRLV